MNKEEFDKMVAEQVAKTLAPVLKRLEATENRLEGMSANCHTFAKFMGNSVSMSADKENEIKSLRADILQLNKSFESVREILNTGKGLHKNDNMLSVSPDDQSMQEFARLIEGQK